MSVVQTVVRPVVRILGATGGHVGWGETGEHFMFQLGEAHRGGLWWT